MRVKLPYEAPSRVQEGIFGNLPAPEVPAVGQNKLLSASRVGGAYIHTTAEANEGSLKSSRRFNYLSSRLEAIKNIQEASTMTMI